MELQDRVVVVTGAGSGIGEAIARAAHEVGARHVVVADLNASLLEVSTGRRWTKTRRPEL